MKSETGTDTREGSRHFKGWIPLIIVGLEILFFVLIAVHDRLTLLGLTTKGPLDRASYDYAAGTVAVILAVGFVTGFFIYTRLGSRVGGVVAIPLAVVESLAYPLIIPFIIIGSATCFYVGESVFVRYLIYGRRLFYVFLTASVIVMAQLIISVHLPPFSLSFIIPGIISYNLHVERGRKKSIAVGIAYFAGLFAIGLFCILVVMPFVYG